MSDQLFMARQPILDAKRETIGYELFYRGEEGNNEMGNPRFSTSSVLVNLLNQVGIHKGVGNSKAFINISADIILTDILYTLPKEIFVFELSEHTIVTFQLVSAIIKLHGLGYEFALDNVSLDEEYLNNFGRIFPYMTYAKFDTTMTDIELLESNIQIYRRFRLIAQKVEFHELYETYRDLGFDLFQGYFFAKPHLIQQSRIDPKHLGVIKIFNMLQRETPLQEVANVFQNHNELSMQLLQYANSTDMLKGRETSSIHEIIDVMGHYRLTQWLLLIIYSKSGRYIDHKKSIHSTTIQRRIDLMLDLLRMIDPPRYDALEGQVRFLAFMSLLEATFNMPLSSVLDNFHVADTIKEALLTNTGVLGRLYALALSIERADYAATQVLLRTFQLTSDDVLTIIERHLYQ